MQLSNGKNGGIFVDEWAFENVFCQIINVLSHGLQNEAENWRPEAEISCIIMEQRVSYIFIYYRGHL
jgi:hypothetical protein